MEQKLCPQYYYNTINIIGLRQGMKDVKPIHVKKIEGNLLSLALNLYKL